VFPFNYVEVAPEAAPEAGEVPAVGEDAPEGAGEEAAASADTSLQVEKVASKATKKEKKKDKSGKKLELATVIAPYEGTSKEQLTLAKGQMVIIKKKSDTGWWQGELQAGGKGKKRSVGWFPASYVKLLAASDGASAAAGSGADVSSGEKYTAIYTYAAQYEDELSFEAGDTVVVIAKDEADWWKGECQGKSGVFPSNYVEPLK